MSERPTPCPDCGTTYNCYPDCHWKCDQQANRIDELEAELWKMSAQLNIARRALEVGKDPNP